jgi:hypothetical protein
MELKLVLDLLNTNLGLKGERPVALKALRIIVSLKEARQA